MSRGGIHQGLAEELGADWTGNAADRPPAALDAAILFAPAGELVPAALRALDRGGILAVAGIYLTPIPELPTSGISSTSASCGRSPPTRGPTARSCSAWRPGWGWSPPRPPTPSTGPISPSRISPVTASSGRRCSGSVNGRTGK